MIFPLSDRSNITRLSRYHSSPSTLAVELYHKDAIAGEAEAAGKRFTQTQRLSGLWHTYSSSGLAGTRG